MSALPPPSPESLPGPEIDPSPAPDEAPASPSPEMPWPPQPAESPAMPPAEAPAPSPVEMPEAPPVHAPSPPPATPITGRACLAAVAFAACVLGALTGPVARAQATNAGVPPAARAGAAAPLSAADRRFMDEAMATGMVEIVLGRLAQEKAVGEPTRRFGLQMVDDHNKANEALKAMAAAKGVPLPTGLTADEKAYVSRMKKSKGATFDKQYLAKMVADHQKAVALFAQASGSAADPDVKAFAQAQLPILRSHLQMAKEASAVPVAQPKRGTAARE